MIVVHAHRRRRGAEGALPRQYATAAAVAILLGACATGPDMEAFGGKIEQIYAECGDRTTALEEVNCIEPKEIEAYREIGSAHIDLLMEYWAYATVVAQSFDAGQITEATALAELKLARARTERAATERNLQYAAQQDAARQAAAASMAGIYGAYFLNQALAPPSYPAASPQSVPEQRLRTTCIQSGNVTHCR